MQKLLFVSLGLAAAAVLAASAPSAEGQRSYARVDVEAAEPAPTRPLLVKKCTGCHGKDLMNVKNKAIAGLEVAKIQEAMGYKIVPDDVPKHIKPAGKIPKRMKSVAKKLSDADKEAIAKWIAACPKTGCPKLVKPAP